MNDDNSVKYYYDGSDYLIPNTLYVKASDDTLALKDILNDTVTCIDSNYGSLTIVNDISKDIDEMKKNIQKLRNDVDNILAGTDTMKQKMPHEILRVIYQNELIPIK